MPTVAIYGNSYVSRLQDFCGGDLRVPASIYWFGKGGLRTDFLNKKGIVDKHAKSMYEQMKSLQPDVVIINVGGNNLSTTTTPREILYSAASWASFLNFNKLVSKTYMSLK